MKTGNRIAFFYTAITVGIIALITIAFYFSTTSYIHRLYYSYLTEKAKATAEKHLERDEVDEDSYARIQKRYEEALPTATEIHLNADSLQTRTILSLYMTEKEIARLYNGETISFHKKEKMGVAIFYPDNEGDFIVLVVSDNQYGADIQKYIAWLLLALIIVATILIYFIGKLYAIRMIDRIDTAYQSEKAFIRNASHELNNPLTAIQGECEISLLKERTPAEYQAALKRIASETKRIIQLMKHLLFLSHGDNEILKNATETIMLADFLMKFVGNRIRFTTDTFAFSLNANPHLLKMAIGNILNNACKYSGEKTVEMCLYGSVLEIKDAGIGIPSEELKRVYQPFFRATNTREFAGHGIGLSLSLRILATYGAKVDIQSELNKGTTVIIDFG